jgi:hypothetical protein
MLRATGCAGRHRRSVSIGGISTIDLAVDPTGRIAYAVNERHRRHHEPGVVGRTIKGQLIVPKILADTPRVAALIDLVQALHVPPAG